MKGKWAFVILVCLVFSSLAPPPARSNEKNNPAPEVVEIAYVGIINPVAAQYIDGNIKYANSISAQALILELDTPGGLDSSMRTIIKAINQSSVPVVAYVAPNGARAAFSARTGA